MGTKALIGQGGGSQDHHSPAFDGDFGDLFLCASVSSLCSMQLNWACGGEGAHQHPHNTGLLLVLFDDARLSVD